MKKRKIKIILTAALLFLAAGICTAFYLYNKGPRDVRNSKGIYVKTVDLYQLYMTDSNKANVKYADRVLEVTGMLSEISVNQQQQQVLMLATGTPGASVNCTMESSVQGVKPKDIVTVKGICSGIGQADEDLGIPADVYLTRCYSK